MISVSVFHVFIVSYFGIMPGGGVLARFYRPGGWGIRPSKNCPGGWSGLELTDT